MTVTNPIHKAQAIRGVVWTAATHAVSLTLTFFVTPILLSGLGAERYGIWSMIVALTGYYGLVNMGIGKANTKYLTQFVATDDEQAVRGVVSTGFFLFCMLALLVVLLAGGVAWIFPWVFKIGGYPAALARGVILLTGLKVAVDLIGQVFGAGLTALKRFGLKNLLQTATLVSTGVGMIIVVSAGGGLVAMAVVMLAAHAVAKILEWLLATRLLGLPQPSPRAINRITASMLFCFGSLETGIQLVRRFTLYGGGLLLGIFVGPAAVAYYTIAESLTRKSLNLGKVMNSVVMPFASHFDAQADRYALRRLVSLSTRTLLALGLLLVTGVFVFGEAFFRLWIGEEIAEHVYPVACILSVAVAIKLPANGMQAALTGIGRMKLLSRIAIAEGVVILLLGLVLTPVLGTIGMACAVLAGQLATSGLLLPYFTCKELRWALSAFVLQTVPSSLASGTAALILALAIRQFTPPTGLVGLLSEGFAVAALSGIVAYYTVFDGSERRELLSNLLRIQTPDETPLANLPTT